MGTQSWTGPRRSADVMMFCSGDYPKILLSPPVQNTGSWWADQNGSLLEWEYRGRAPCCQVPAEQDGACLLPSAALCVGGQRHEAAKGWGCGSAGRACLACRVTPGFCPHRCTTGSAGNICNPSSCGVETGGSAIQGHPQL